MGHGEPVPLHLAHGSRRPVGHRPRALAVRHLPMGQGGRDPEPERRSRQPLLRPVRHARARDQRAVPPPAGRERRGPDDRARQAARVPARGAQRRPIQRLHLRGRLLLDRGARLPHLICRASATDGRAGRHLTQPGEAQHRQLRQRCLQRTSDVAPKPQIVPPNSPPTIATAVPPHSRIQTCSGRSRSSTSSGLPPWPCWWIRYR